MGANKLKTLMKKKKKKKKKFLKKNEKKKFFELKNLYCDGGDRREEKRRDMNSAKCEHVTQKIKLLRIILNSYCKYI